MSKDGYEAHEPGHPLGRDKEFIAWTDKLRTLSASAASIRQADAIAADARRVKDLQARCAPITVRSVRDNAATMADKLVLLDEISGVHAGLCVAMPGPRAFDPMFIQVVAVAPDAQRRGVGLALLTAAAERWPHRDLVFATQDDNTAVRALNEKFTRGLGAVMRRVTLRTYSDRDLGINRGFGYRAWIIEREANKATSRKD